jgi:hypothetical protein
LFKKKGKAIYEIKISYFSFDKNTITVEKISLNREDLQDKIIAEFFLFLLDRNRKNL